TEESMRTYACIPLAAALLLSAPPHRAKGENPEHHAVAEIKRLGGDVTVDEKLPGSPVIEVDLSFTAADAATLALLRELPEIRSLRMVGPKVNDADIARLR